MILYFYATNIENIEKNDKNIDISKNYYQLMSWDNYFVWDDFQKKTIENFIHLSSPTIKDTAKITIAGTIPYSDKKVDIKINKDSKNLIIFDIPLYRPANSFYFDIDKFYSYQTLKKFYLDIIEIVKLNKNKKIILYAKIKNRSLKNLDKRYINFIKKN